MPLSTSNQQLASLLAALGQRGDLRHVKPGELLITEGQRDDSLYLLISGRLKVFTRDQKGREFIYNVMKPGEIFGEMGLDGGLRSASVEAIELSSCSVVPRDRLRDFMREQPEFAEHLLLTLIGRLRRATRQIRRLVQSDVYERTIELLRAEAIVEKGVRLIPTVLTQKEIAARVGATREMIGHILRDLQRGGILVRDEKKRFVIRREFPERW